MVTCPLLLLNLKTTTHQQKNYRLFCNTYLHVHHCWRRHISIRFVVYNFSQPKNQNYIINHLYEYGMHYNKTTKTTVICTKFTMSHICVLYIWPLVQDRWTTTLSCVLLYVRSIPPHLVDFTRPKTWYPYVYHYSKTCFSMYTTLNYQTIKMNLPLEKNSYFGWKVWFYVRSSWVRAY